MTEEKRPFVPQLDLRSITREGPGVMMVSIRLRPSNGDQEGLWLQAGGVKLRWNARDATLSAYLRNDATCMEHKSAYAFQLPLIGAHFDTGMGIDNGVWLEAWIAPLGIGFDRDDFRLPGPGHDPFSAPYATACREAERYCQRTKGHPIVPYAGPPAEGCRDLWKRLSGMPVDIHMYPWLPVKEAP